ncbi:MAG: class I SAM-dependent methyltransferase [Christensenellales bacterium]|jgi:2-polyprenyl-3-methyl-5-hydroxy-6-metoxy-1,4-benzoquinol methylase
MDELKNRLMSLEDSLERARALYEEFFTREDERLSGSLWLERMTTLHVLGQELKPGSRVMDLGCGAGVYSLPLAKAGHSVLAADLVPHHVETLKGRAEPGMALKVLCQDAQSAVDAQEDAGFDAVLCLGPMYHLRTRAERLRLMVSCRRLLKPGGQLFVSFINNDWVIAEMTLNGEDAAYILEGDYDQSTFRCEDFPFVFHTLDQADAELRDAGLVVARRVNADGLNEIMSEKFSVFTPGQRAAWFRYHLYLCEQPQHLGACNHWLYVCR